VSDEGLLSIDRADLIELAQTYFLRIAGDGLLPFAPSSRLPREAGLYRRASSRQPPGGSIGAIVGSCIEGNRRAWGSLMNSIDDGFK
jgi:hypothetical protein